MRPFSYAAALLLPALLGGCSAYLPYAGPRAGPVNDVEHNKALQGIRLVDVNYALARVFHQEIYQPDLALLDQFRNPAPSLYTVGPGDVLEVHIWEAPPAMLFSPSVASTTTPSGSIMTTIPPQMVNAGGQIFMPFAGEIPCADKTTQQIAAEIRAGLQGKAHDPQVVVSLVRNRAQSISVVGNVKDSKQVPMEPGGVSVLQALAAAGGVVQPVSKVTIQLSRSGQVLRLPLEDIIANPRENISLRSGDVLTALYQPLHVTIMGATQQSKEVDFEASGISLAQALVRAGGINGNEADAKAVFVFRLESPKLVPGLAKGPLVDGKVPVVFRFDFSNPATLFVAQEFPIQNKDLIYVASAPVTDLQKFLGLIVQIVYPIQGLTTAGVIK
ncbi:MAG: polysaccharide export protein [Acidithiobacillus sp.]|nr:polysaccharide export protein [Acidithiobacillus sp.]